MRPFRPGESGYVGPGITFLRTPLVLDPEELTGVDVAILGAPFDEGVTYRPGTRFGPRAIRLADHSGIGGRTHMEVGVDPKAVLKIVDFGDIEAPPSDLLKAHALLRSHVGMILAKGAIPVVLGGDHSLSAPMMQAIADCHGPDGYAVIHFDTHADTGFLDEPTPYNHGTPFYRGVTEGFMRGDHIFQIGLRGTWPNPPEFDWMRKVGFHWRTMAEVMEIGLNAVVDEAIAYATSMAPRVYLTVDIDVLDPAFAPGTGTPEPGGLMTRELLSAVRRIASSVDLCAMDMVEVSPPYDVAEITAQAAHRVVLETLTGIALRRSGCCPKPQRSQSVDFAPDNRRSDATLECAAITSRTPRIAGLRKDEFTRMEFFVGIPVRSLDGSLDWYKRLLGREPDLLDGDHAAVWDLAEGRSLYIVDNPEHVGHLVFTMYFDDLDAVIAEIAERGIEPVDQATNEGDVRTFQFRDPDGNEIDFGWYPH